MIETSSVSSHTEELWYNETVLLWMTIYIFIYIYWSGVARGVVVGIVGNEHGDPSSKPARGLHISQSANTLGKGMNPNILTPSNGRL